MSVKVSKGKPASEEAILALERVVAHPISKSFRNFVATHDGATPESNIFQIINMNGKNNAGVNKFIPVAEIPRELAFISSELPEHAYPVAWASCGNYVVIDEASDGVVFFWDHELAEGLTKLANNFEAFLELLEPFDINLIKLDPAQVKKVWIDPEFLKQLNNK